MRKAGTILALVILLPLAAPAKGEGAAPAEALYRERCASCHEMGVARAPRTELLRQMPRDRILLALTSGSMSVQAEGLAREQLERLAAFLGAPPSTQAA